jgi:Mn-dependent DtxR family transcriptional regulator
VEVPYALVPVGLALIATIAFVLLLWKELKLVTFDPGLATALGVSAAFVHYALMTLTAGVTVASFEAVGSILVVAMLIVPAAAAHLLTDRLSAMIGWAVAIAVLSAIAGYACDYALNTGMAGAIAVAAGGQFLLAALFAPRHGLAARAWRRLSMAVRIHGEDIVARIYRQEERAGHALEAVSLPAARGLARFALLRMKRRALVAETNGGLLALTPAGRQLAESIVRAHRLWEGFLGAHFELPLDHLHEPAERIEHFIGPELQAQLEEVLQHPGVDPHGRPIPRPDGV